MKYVILVLGALCAAPVFAQSSTEFNNLEYEIYKLRREMHQHNIDITPAPTWDPTPIYNAIATMQRRQIIDELQRQRYEAVIRQHMQKKAQKTPYTKGNFRYSAIVAGLEQDKCRATRHLRAEVGCPQRIVARPTQVILLSLASVGAHPGHATARNSGVLR